MALFAQPPTTLLTLVFTLNHNAHSSYEDLRALDGGADGLSVIIPIMKFASEHLVEGGLVLLEVDPCHPLISTSAGKLADHSNRVPNNTPT